VRGEAGRLEFQASHLYSRQHIEIELEKQGAGAGKQKTTLYIRT
jgi:hypothetical protein